MQEIQQQEMRAKQPQLVKPLKSPTDSKKVAYFYGLGCKTHLVFKNNVGV